MRFSAFQGYVFTPAQLAAAEIEFDKAYAETISRGFDYYTAVEKGNAAKAAYLKAIEDAAVASARVEAIGPGNPPPPGSAGETVYVQQRSTVQSTTKGMLSAATSAKLALNLTAGILAKKIADRANTRSGTAAADLLDAEIKALQAEGKSLTAQITVATGTPSGGAPIQLGTTTGAPATNGNTPSTGGTTSGTVSVSPDTQAEAARKAAAAAAWKANQEAVAAAAALQEKQAAAEAEAQAAADAAKTAAEKKAAEDALARIKAESIAPSGGGLGWFALAALAVKWFIF